MTMSTLPLLLAGVLTLSAAAEGIADVEATIPTPVKALGKPAIIEFPAGIRMAVSAATETAQTHVLQGLNHLHGGWEFEASRHFAVALREDEDCLLAHWGMLMCLLNPTPETNAARIATAERMLALIEQGKGTELERGYAYGLLKYIDEGPASAAVAYRKVAARFPNDLQAAVLAAIFSRGGFDDSGDATPDQERAEQDLKALIDKYPLSPVPLNALLFIRAEASDLTESLRLARRLVQIMPTYPPFAHLLGHYEWRTGNHGPACNAFSRATTLYREWMEANKATTDDCPEWMKAEAYRIVSLASRGELDAARSAARKLAATPLNPARPASAGNRYLLWEAKTLPVRLMLPRLTKANAQEIAALLPKPSETEKLRNHSAVHWWIDGLRIAIESKRLIASGDFNGGRDALAALSTHIETMSGAKEAAIVHGELSFWGRTQRSLELLANESRGDLALIGPAENRGTAYNWFSAAADRQRHASLLLPPAILTPMATRIGSYYLESKQPDEAIDSYHRALRFFPNHLDALLGLKRAFTAAGKTADAEETARTIEALKKP